MTDVDAKGAQFRVELVGYTKAEGPQKVRTVVALDDEACAEAKLVTYRGDDKPYELVTVTDFIQSEGDLTQLKMMALVFSRLGLEAFRAGVKWKQDRLCAELGLVPGPEGD